MKKLFLGAASMLFAAVLLCAPTLAGETAPTSVSAARDLVGDLNGDGFIGNGDVYDMTEYYAWNDSTYYYEEEMHLPQVFAMDIDANGVANLGDVYYVLEYSAWNIDEIKQTYTGQN